MMQEKSIAEISRLINEIEDQFPVDAWIIDDIHIWPLIRFSLFNQISNSIEKKTGLNKKSIYNKLKRFSSFVNVIGSHFSASILDRKHNQRGIKDSPVIFFTHTTCRTKIFNVWIDMFCEPMIDLLKIAGYNSIVLEWAPENEYRFPRSNQSTFVELNLFFLKVFSRFKKKLFFNNKNLEDYDLLTPFLSSKGFNVRPLSIENICLKVNEIKNQYKYFEKLLLEVKPKFAFVVTYYGANRMAFILACKKLNIPVYDIQHGLQGEYHNAYGRWKKIPELGYELLPTGYLTWSDEDKRNIEIGNNGLGKQEYAFVTGNLWLKIWQNDEVYFVNAYNEKIAKIKSKYPNDAIHILLTLQKGVGITSELRLAISNSPSNYIWWIRAHPSMTNERKDIRTILSKFEDRVYEFENATDFPLYAILKHMNIHVTCWSSVVIEASEFRIPSIIVHENGALYFKKYVENNTAVISYGSCEILNMIEKLSKERLPITEQKSNSISFDINEFIKFLDK